MLRRSAALLAALALVGVVTLASPAAAETRVITVLMTGEEERPLPGDPDGIGVSRFVFDTRLDRVCYVLYAVGIVPASAAHIHVAPVGSPGPIVIGLIPPTNGRSAGCTTDPDVDAIVANPANYYVNFHNLPFPGGALRGQLGR